MRSTKYKAYLRLPRAVLSPYRISTCTTPPKTLGRAREVVNLFDLSLKAVVPRSMIGSTSDVEIEEFFCDVARINGSVGGYICPYCRTYGLLVSVVESSAYDQSQAPLSELDPNTPLGPRTSHSPPTTRELQAAHSTGS